MQEWETTQKRVQSALCTRMRIVFSRIRELKTSVRREKCHCHVYCTRLWCDFVQLRNTGSSSTPLRVVMLCEIREASLVAQNIFKNLHMLTCVDCSTPPINHTPIQVSRDFHYHSSPLYHLPDELVSLMMLSTWSLHPGFSNPNPFPLANHHHG